MPSASASGGASGATAAVPPPPVNPGDLGRGPMIMGVSWTLTIICIVIIGLRFYVRKTVARAWSSDDWFMLAAVICQLVFQAFATEAFTWGLGKHDPDLTPTQMTQVLKWNWVSTTPALCVSVLARISAAILLIRIFGSKKWLKWFLITFTTLQSVVAIVIIAMVWACTRPVEAIWNPLMPADRWDPRIQTYSVYFGQSLFAVSDLTYVLFPILVIYKLNMPLRRKIGLAIMMSASLVTMAASIMKTITSQDYTGSSQPQYNASIAILWSSIEQTFVIIMSCIPPLRAAAKIKIPWLRSLRSSLGGSKASKASKGSHGSRYGNNSAVRWSGGGHHAKAAALYDDDLLETPGVAHDLESGPSPFSGEKVAFPAAAHDSHTKHGRGGSEDSTRGIMRTDTYGITYDSRHTSRESGDLPMAL